MTESQDQDEGKRRRVKVSGGGGGDQKAAYNCAPWDANFEQNKPKFRSERVILSGGDDVTSKSSPFEKLSIGDTGALDSVTERSTCPLCSKSYKYFCYLCNVSLPSTKDVIPVVARRLPCKVDIIKDPREVDGKSTAIHARIICPQDVRIFDFPQLPPELDRNDDDEHLLFLYPNPKASSLDDIARDYGQLFASAVPDDGVECTGAAAAATKKTTVTTFRLIVVDAAWKNAKKIVREVEKRNLRQVQIADRDTLFWRYQTGLSKKHLATIEAIYYFLVDFHVIVMGREYQGEYDNLLFLFKFMYEKIHNLYDKSTLRSYNRRHESLTTQQAPPPPSASETTSSSITQKNCGDS